MYIHIYIYAYIYIYISNNKQPSCPQRLYCVEHMNDLVKNYFCCMNTDTLRFPYAKDDY